MTEEKTIDEAIEIAQRKLRGLEGYWEDPKDAAEDLHGAARTLADEVRKLRDLLRITQGGKKEFTRELSDRLTTICDERASLREEIRLMKSGFIRAFMYASRHVSVSDDSLESLFNGLAQMLNTLTPDSDEGKKD